MKSKRASKQRRPGQFAGAHGSAIPFEDNKGNVMQLDGKLTIADLVKMGMKEIRLMPEGSPLPDNWWRDAGSPNDQAQRPGDQNA
jgi:hypothetical protein